MSYWIAPVARAIPALALAAVVTFSSDHSPALGLTVFATFALASGVVIVWFAARSPRSSVRAVQLIQGTVSLILGVCALVFASSGLLMLIWLVSMFGAVTGFLELSIGVRGRGNHESARDWMFVGALTIALAIAVLVVPPDFVQPFAGPDEVSRELTASVIIVGVLGAYWAVIGVYLVIAGLSLKWAVPPTQPKEIEAQ